MLSNIRLNSLFSIVLTGSMLFFFITGCGGERVNAVEKAVLSADGIIEFDTDRFNDGIARHFVYHSGEIKIRFFILKSVDGIIRTAFDACDVCWRSDKGYLQQGEYMICRNCGMSFTSTGINEIRGGCNPAPLMSNLKDGKVFITGEALAEGEQYFKF